MSQTAKTWKILDLLKVTEEHFRKNSIQSARLNSEMLLCSVLNTKRINLYLDFEKPLTVNELDNFREKVKRRISGEPLQYILGETEFYGLNFKVNPSVLIPRQETELLVDKAIKILTSGLNENPRILEIGTGSGCISIALASKILCTINAIDLSEDAIRTAKENSTANNTHDKITFLNKDFLTEINYFNGYDLVLSNPPYIAIDDFESLEKQVRDFEPKQALTDEGDGLSFYSKFIEAMEKTNGNVNILAEIGDGKKDKVESLLKESGIEYTFYKDLMNIDRVVHLKK